MKYILLANLAATLFMVGLVWFVQVVHYSLFARVDREGFALYSGAHSCPTSYVVRPRMLIEASTTKRLQTILLSWRGGVPS